MTHQYLILSSLDFRALVSSPRPRNNSMRSAGGPDTSSPITVESAFREFGNVYHIDPAILNGVVSIATRDLNGVVTLAQKFGHCDPEKTEMLVTVIDNLQMLSGDNLLENISSIGKKKVRSLFLSIYMCVCIHHFLIVLRAF